MGNKTGKQTKLNAAAKQYDNESQPFQEYSDDVFDALDSDDERLPIGVIHADFTQPRRTVPKDIRGEWQGAAGNLPALLEKWRDKCGLYPATVKKMLMGKIEPLPNEPDSISAQKTEFVKLLGLAVNIRDIGLQQPIGVRKLGGGHYEIIFGERRWMAYHALALWLGDEWRQIPAKVIKVSAWEVAKIQAAENFQRVGINAIGKARQLAKLIIRARQDTQDPAYDSWSRMVIPGGCDRPWYAQVADGYNHPIPTGMGTQFEQALGISTNQMRQYRALLRLTEDYEVDNQLWDLGDECAWPERLMRDISQLPIETIRTILKESPDIEAAFRGAIASAKMSQPAGFVTMVTNPGDVEPETEPTEPPAVIEDTPETVAETTPEEEAIDKTDADYWIKKPAIVRAGQNRFKGTVIEGIGNRVRVEYADGGSGWHDVWQLEEAPAVTLGEGPLRHNETVRIKLDLPPGWHTTENPPAGTEGVVVSEKGLRGFRDGNGKLWTQFRVGTGRNQRDYEPALNHVERIPAEAPAQAQENQYAVGDRVVVLKHGLGTIRYYKDNQYGVYLDSSQTTHYYDVDQLRPKTALDGIWPSQEWVGREAWIGSIRVDVLKAVMHETVTVRQDDGREYDAHLSILYDMPPKPVKHFQPGQRVKLVRDVESPAMAAGAMGTVMRLGSAISSITGVNFDDTAGTIFSVKVDGQEEKVLELCEAVEAPSESASTTEQPDVVDMYWKPIRVGDTVKTPRGKTCRVSEIVGKVLWVDDHGTLVRAFADKVEVIVPAAPSADAPPVPADSPTPAETATPGTPLSATQLVSRLVTYDGQPAVVVGNVGSEEVIIQLGKERKQVPISAIVVDERGDVRLKDAVDGPATNGETEPVADTDDTPDDDDIMPLFADKKHGDLYDLLIGLAEYIGDSSSIATLRKLERITYGQARAMEGAAEQTSEGPQTLWKQNIQRIHDISAHIIEDVSLTLLEDLKTWLDEVEAEGRS